MKQNLLWISALLLMLAGCSSDDDITIKEKNILGYWKSEATYNDPWGLMFASNGEIKYWEYSPIIGVTNNEQYSEGHWGLWWIEDVVGYEKSSAIHIKEGSKTPNPDELYYQVMSLTKDRLVIRHFGGFAGTPLEKGTDVTYKKIDKPY